MDIVCVNSDCIMFLDKHVYGSSDRLAMSLSDMVAL